MDPFSIATGGGGLSSSSGSDGRLDGSASFGGYGQTSYNFGSGSVGTSPNYWLIGGLIVAGLAVAILLRK